MKAKVNRKIVYKTEAAFHRCSAKQVFLKILQISHENYCVGNTF